METASVEWNLIAHVKIGGEKVNYFIPDGMEAPPKSVIEQPELQVYISGFGKKDDHCLVAEVGEKLVGAVWSRIMAGTI